jgi:hypothetical protein
MCRDRTKREGIHIIPSPALSGSGSTGRRRSRVALSAFGPLPTVIPQCGTATTGRVGSPNTLKIGRSAEGVKPANWPVICCKPFMQEKGNYELVEPFDMDDAMLQDISPQLAFILGVEYQIFREKLKSGRPFTTLCLPQNAARLVKMAEHHERFVEDRPRVFAGWTEIFVGDTIL